MTEAHKKKLLVVVVVFLAFFSTPVCSFTQEIQSYSQEISRRSFAMMDGISGLFDTEGTLMRVGYPVFIVITFLSALNQLCVMVAGFIPSIAGLISFGGPLAMLAGFPVQDVARDGENRDQRLLDYVEDQVKSSITAGQSEFENELKKKKK